MTNCIPANPDISGIGVRAAIYAQNLFCFAPVVAHLWDGAVSVEEMEGVKDQSIGMLAVAFAILISTIVEATSTTIVGGQGLTRFHAAIILDLSWMNNTSTWIWFLLYVHHRTKPDENSKKEPILASWSAWSGVLLSPVRLLVGSGKAGDTENGGDHAMTEATITKTSASFARQAWTFTTKKLVLTIGSFHLSLMAAIGLWLWSNPSKFGSPIENCTPSLSVVGGVVSFSSLGLRIFSLAIYCLLVIPGLNLLLPFLFFLALHISYNKLHPQLDHLRHSTRRIPSSIGALFCRRGPKRDGAVSGIDLGDTSGTISAKTPYLERLDRTAFLIVGLVCLIIINIILLVDVELTLQRNKHNQSEGENDWGFGQVLALLLLVVPLRDFVTSIMNIREKMAKDREARENIQKSYNQHLQEAIKDDNFGGHDFLGLIEQGADPNAQLDGVGEIVTLLQFAASKGNANLVQLLLEKGVEDTEGWAFHSAARNKHSGILEMLAQNRGEENEKLHPGPVLRGLEKSFQDTNSEASRVALEWLSPFQAQRLGAKFWEEFRSIIPMLMGSLLRHKREVIQAALEWLIKLGAETALRTDLRPAIPMVVELLKDDNWNIRGASIKCLSSLGAHAELQPDIRLVIPLVVALLKHDNSVAREASIQCLSSLGAHTQLQPDIRPAIPLVVELLKDDNWHVRGASIQCLSSLGEHTEFHPDIRPAIPLLAELLKDDHWDVREASIKCLSSFGAHTELQPDIRPEIPLVVGLLKDEHWKVRRASIECLSSLQAHTELHADIRLAIPLLTELLKDDRWAVREASIKCLSTLVEHTALWPDIE